MIMPKRKLRLMLKLADDQDWARATDDSELSTRWTVEERMEAGAGKLGLSDP